MNNDYQEPPPSYNDVIQKSNDQSSSKGRAAAYAVPSHEHTGTIRYAVPNETVPNNSSIQMNPITKLGEQPIQCTCANCHSLIITQVRETPGILVWILCFVLILFGCWFGCCLIPFCIRDIQNTQHYCPNCKAFIGEYRPL